MTPYPIDHPAFHWSHGYRPAYYRTVGRLFLPSSAGATWGSAVRRGCHIGCRGADPLAIFSVACTTGLAVCCTTVALFSCVRDRLNGDDAERAFSFLNGTLNIVLALAPMAGGFLAVASVGAHPVLGVARLFTVSLGAGDRRSVADGLFHGVLRQRLLDYVGKRYRQSGDS